MDNLGEARRRAFSMWLRTGRLPDWARTRNDEVKFNPWHDADDGRFTHAGTGRYFGRGSSRAAVARMHERPSEPGRREDRFGGFSPDEGPDPDPGFNMGGASGDYQSPDPSVHRGELAQGGRPETHGANLAHIAANRAKGWGRTIWNGYHWWLDAAGRLREVEGTINVGVARRSRTAQRQAGQPDRRPTDDGGHYIAPRFNGPTEAFNHFAQDRNFNRGRYRTLEDQWAKALRTGKRVDVRIIPVYESSSRRPSLINVWFWIDGRRQSLQFPNEPLEASHAKR